MAISAKEIGENLREKEEGLGEYYSWNILFTKNKYFI